MGENVRGDSGEIISPVHVFRIDEESIGYDIENGGPDVTDEFRVLTKKDLDEFVMSCYEHVASDDISASEFMLLNPGGYEFFRRWRFTELVNEALE